MAKSKLSTEEIRSLRNGGVPASEIAELASTTKANVNFRLSPTRHRRYAKERYRRLEPTEREAYTKAERERQQKNQAETALLAEKVGDLWTDEELDYLRQWGTTKTCKEIALDLKRTFHGVRNTGKRYQIPLKK